MDADEAWEVWADRRVGPGPGRDGPTPKPDRLSGTDVSPGAVSAPQARRAVAGPGLIAAGLTSGEARARAERFGPNLVREERPHRLRQFCARFWSPIAWLLEATLLIQLFIGERLEAAIIGALLMLNALLGFLQEGRVQKALDFLRHQLRVQARVRRDDRWVTLPEHEIVRVVRDLFVLNAALVILVLGLAHHRQIALADILPLVLSILLASIPVALPATFTLAAALGSLELSRFGVLVTRLSALHDVAAMSVLCSDFGVEDAVRPESREVVSAIREAGVRVVMVTGDNALTARAVAEQVGIPVRLCPPEKLRGDLRNGTMADCSVFAGVFPEDKFRLVRALQRHGAVVGMSGDGVNDAPALRQAEAGVAVANATDVAKAAAAIVLARPGLRDVLPAIEVSRRVFQRILTCTLDMLSKKIEMMVLLVAGFLLTGREPLTPLLMVLFIFLNDFLTMAISTDRMSISSQPNPWRTRPIVIAGVGLGICRLLLSLGVFAVGDYALGLDLPHLQSLTFATVLLSSQAGVYLLRERGPWWTSRPSRGLLCSTLLAVGVTAVLTLQGVAMAPTSPVLFLNVAAVSVLYYLALDWVKVWLFDRLSLR